MKDLGVPPDPPLPGSDRFRPIPLLASTALGVPLQANTSLGQIGINRFATC